MSQHKGSSAWYIIVELITTVRYTVKIIGSEFIWIVDLSSSHNVGGVGFVCESCPMLNFWTKISAKLSDKTHKH